MLDIGYWILDIFLLGDLLRNYLRIFGIFSAFICEKSFNVKHLTG
jgi:hypothetical protein